MGFFKEHIEKIISIEKEGVDNREREYELRRRWKERGKENKRDKELYELFRKNALEGKDKNDDRFRLSYITDLPVDWNILICLGKKNIGKSWNIHRLIDECILEDRHIVMVRVLAKEFDTALCSFFDDETSKVRVQRRSGGMCDLLLKPQNAEEFNKRNRLKKVGFCANITSLTSYQGSSYDKVKYIIWDECISDGSTQKLSKYQISSFERFISSVVRDKKDVKVFIFGNLLSKIEGHTGDPLLNYYGIDPSCGCKYIPATKGHEANILFINCKELFKGIEDQKVLGGVDDYYTTNLLTNELDQVSIKVVNDYFFYKATKLYTLVFTYNLRDIAIHIREIIEPGLPRYLVIMVKDFYISDVFKDNDDTIRIYTNEEAIANTYSQCVTFIDKNEWNGIIEDFLEYMAVNRVLYANSRSQSEIIKYAKHFKNDLSIKKTPFGRKFFEC